ncbi:MAG: DUF664 domain-containing protein, partial [Actinobacteria bacterium]|nr:DUF664 domain-containing protein [Actinomycetota bacterium]
MPGTVPPVADEREGLLAFLAQQRDGLKTTAYGLTDEQARTASTAGTLTVGGLIKHVTHVERNWMDTVLQRPRQTDPNTYADNFRLLPDETLADVIARYDETAKETESIIAGIPDLGQ